MMMMHKMTMMTRRDRTWKGNDEERKVNFSQTICVRVRVFKQYCWNVFVALCTAVSAQVILHTLKHLPIHLFVLLRSALRSNMATAGLFNQDQTASGDQRGEKKLKAPRTKLQDRDAVSAMLFNPMGKANLSKVPLKDLWDAMKDGDKYVKYHSEFCASEEDGGAYRVGVGLSKLAGVYVEGIEALKDPDLTKYLKEDMLKEAMDEAEVLKRSLDVLNVGKDHLQGNQDGGMKAIKKRKTAPKPPPTSDQMTTAAQEFYTWLKKPESPLRSLIAFLAGDGVFYAAYTAEKCGRAWIHEQPCSSEAFANAAKARIASNSSAQSSGTAAPSVI